MSSLGPWGPNQFSWFRAPSEPGFSRWHQELRPVDD
eukprot:CAMPEP_0206496746 /NCGR_PEP_ID=MMETSP0324_2-20121206/49654_1 /ASSEMBLY_ACC=CAM_ASM_000836 /TAXON_ID=2866 /ORGANISM="Crypthecodinium cohnii, Strain Seligo" /LENGTH=35 /DNA_ID= /DNA_START= /DNA_END= /DNA_ORIENTATION=